MRPVICLDTETTGLYPELGHEIWEAGLIAGGTEHMWRVEPDLALADPAALEVNGYRERTAAMMHSPSAVLHDLAVEPSATWGYWSEPAALARELARVLAGVTIVAANPAFDAGMLAAFLARHGYAPPWAWHYRLRDIQSMAWGYLHGRARGSLNARAAQAIPPMDASTDELAAALGIDPAAYDRHSSLGDCRLVTDMLGAVTWQPE